MTVTANLAVAVCSVYYADFCGVLRALYAMDTPVHRQE